MKFPKFSYFVWSSIALSAVILTTLVSQAQAAPTVRPFGGVTSVQLSADFVSALGTLKLTPGVVTPGDLSEGVTRFPISGGGLDQETLKGDIFHIGGLSLTNPDGITVQLFNFIIDTTGEQAVLTGLVTVNDDLVGRIPLFNLNLAHVQVEANLFSLIISGATLHLTADAAQALNDGFGVEAFVEGFSIGAAEISALF